MNILNKATLAELKKNRTRTLVTIIGVVLSAAMLTAVTTFGVSLLGYMAEGAAQKYGGWHLEWEDVDADFAARQAADPAVADIAVAQNLGYAEAVGIQTTEAPCLQILAFDEKTFAALPLTVFSGKLPRNSGELLIAGNALTKGGLSWAVGDTVTLTPGTPQRLGGNAGAETFAPGQARTYTVAGICKTPAFAPDGAPGYIAITVAEAGEQGAGESLNLFVTLKNPRDIGAYAARAAEGHRCCRNNAVLRFLGLSDDPGDGIFNALLYAIGGIVIAIVMVGSVFLIYNSFNISLTERTHQFGILASVGATEKQLRHSVLFEGLCIGAVGIPLGVAAGLLGIQLVIAVVGQNFAALLYSGVTLRLTLSAPAILAAVAVSLITILISAYIPAQKAAAQPVMECIRQSNDVKVEAKAVKTSPLVERLCGLEATLALKNFKRNKKRYRSIVLSLVLSVVLFIATSAFVEDLRQASAGMNEAFTYEIGVGTPGMADDEMLALFDTLKTAPGVSDGSYQALVYGRCPVKAASLSEACRKTLPAGDTQATVALPVKLEFLDDDAYARIVAGLGLPAAEYTGADGKLLVLGKMKNAENPQAEVGQLENLFVDPPASLSILPGTGTTAGAEIDGETGSETAAQTVRVTFVELVPPDTLPALTTPEPQPYTFQVMAPYSRRAAMEAAVGPLRPAAQGLTFRAADPDKAAAELQARIEQAGAAGGCSLYNVYAMMDENRNYIFIANVFAYTFIVLISLIAVANVFNTISTNIRLRRRELAMLRSVGMSDRAFNRMMRVECAFYGLRALAVGLPLAVVASWLIYQGMLLGGAEGIRFVLPWASMGISVGSVLLVIFVTMMYAVRRLKRENIIDALRDDMA